MESVSETFWDVVICGTGLQQSLLALSLSRSGKKILHIDPNHYYGGHEAALSVAEAESWAEKHACRCRSSIGCASATRAEAAVASVPAPARGYSLALAPQLVHARSALLSQLVSSRAHRHVDFVAVGSFFVYQVAPAPALSRIPATREDVFSTTAMPARAKRALMKFLKFVLDHEAEEKRAVWQPYAERPLTDFLRDTFALDEALQTYVVALTLSLHGRITTESGLRMMARHVGSVGVFGPGFAAVYPKWGGLSEVAQVACRAAAVGGATYMLGTDLGALRSGKDGLEMDLTSGDKVRTRTLVREGESSVDEETTIARLVAIVDKPLPGLFETVVEGSPSPAVAIMAVPAGSVQTTAGEPSRFPIYASAHSTDTGECPAGQSVLYLTTLSQPSAREVLEQALRALLSLVGSEEAPQSRFQLYYEQAGACASSNSSSSPAGGVLELPPPPLGLSFDDSLLDAVKEAWRRIVGPDVAEEEYMMFADRKSEVDEDAYE